MDRCYGWRMPVAHQLAFFAPIPRGHEVLLVTFNMEGKSPKLVLDRTAANLYCPDALWGALHQDPVLAVSDPVAVLTRWSWTVQSAVAGICAGAVLSTKQSGGDRHDAKTLLLIEPAAAPYR